MLVYDVWIGLCPECTLQKCVQSTDFILYNQLQRLRSSFDLYIGNEKIKKKNDWSDTQRISVSVSKYFVDVLVPSHLRLLMIDMDWAWGRKNPKCECQFLQIPN